MKLIDTATFAGLMVIVGINSASAGQFDGSNGRGPLGPPPEAYEACSSRSEGDAVEITTPRGDTLKAVCKKINGKLAAVPEGMPGGGQTPPPGGPSGNSQ